MSATWIQFALPNQPGLVLLRVEESESGRLVFTEVSVASRPRVSTDTLREIPLGRLEARINEPDEAARLREQMTLDRDRAEDSARVGIRTYLDPPSRADLDRLIGELVDIRLGRRKPPKRELRVTVPRGSRKPDSFYEAVATAYRKVAEFETGPAAAIAEANRVPVETVYAWVKEARRRGLLTSARDKRKDSE